MRTLRSSFPRPESAVSGKQTARHRLYRPASASLKRWGFSTLSGATAVLLVVALVPLATVASLFASAEQAQAATNVTIGSITGQLADHVGTAADFTTPVGTSSSNCVTYAQQPGGGTSTSTSSPIVTNPNTAFTAHGRTGNNCPNSLSTNSQSAIGFQPSAVTSVTTGTTFLLGRMQHNNTAVTIDASFFTGNLNVGLSGTTMKFPWTMWETPNQTPCDVGPNSGSGLCYDQVKFASQIADQSFSSGGLNYKAVVQGFTAASADNSCPAVPSGTNVNNFLTAEGQVTYGCLYASIQQVRTLKIVKQALAPYSPPATIPAFNFTTSSTLTGSPWANAPFSLTPTAIGAAGSTSITRELVTGQTVSVSETSPSGNNWAFTSLSCVDGAGAAIGAVSGATVTFSGDFASTTAAAAPITCSYANTFTPRATLTLIKNVVSTGQPAPSATKSSWTLSAVGNSTISGAGDSSAVTNQSVIAGSYTLGEAPVAGANTAGYVRDGAWVCQNGQTPLTLGGTADNPTVSLANAANVTCTVTNKYQTGTLAVTKTVAGPSGGYLLGTGKSFTATYNCTLNGVSVANGTLTLAPNASNGSAGNAATVANVPAGASCIVTESNAPTGSTGLANSSYEWASPSYAASSQVTIPANGRATVDITNPYVLNTGSLTVSKTVAPRAGVPAAGYINQQRAFPIAYSCSLGSTVVASATVQIANAGSQTITGIPATAVCSVSETLTAASGDFVDPSYEWDGNSIPAAVTIPKNGTATATVTNHFTRNLVDLVLAKRVTGAGYSGTTKDFTVNYNCGTPYVGSVTLDAGGSEPVRVPAGVICRVSESAVAQALLAGGYVWDAPSYSGLNNGEVTVNKGQSATVTVTNNNRIGFGRIAVSKVVGDFASQIASGTTFPVTVSCPAPAQGETTNYSAALSLTANAAAVITPYLPIGTVCSVSENPAPAASANLPADGSYVWGTPPAALSVTVPNSTNPAVAKVVNTIARAYGSFSITKDFVNNAEPYQPATAFAGTWECTRAGDAPVGGTWSITGGGSATLSGDDSSRILLGSSCTVTEDELAAAHPSDPSYVWTQQGASPTAITVAEPHGTAVVTNTLSRVAGSFSVSKIVEGADAGEGFPAGAVFPFTYSCSPADGGVAITGSFTVAAGAANGPTDAQIPAGSRCELTEGANPAPLDPFRWDGVELSVSGAASSTLQEGRSVSFVTTANAASVVVQAVNSMSAKTATVSVSKRVTGETAGFTGGSEPMFPIAVSCDGVAQTPKQVANGAAVSFTDIPLGASCIASEGSFTGGLFDGSYAWGTPSIAPASVIVADDGASIEVVNPIVRVYAPISLSKVFTDNGFADVIAADTEYSGSWSCSYGNDAAITGTWSGTGSASGTPATLTGVPERGVLVGSLCAASEDPLSTPSASDPSYRWNTPSFDDATVAASGGTMTVTNSLRRDTGSLTVSKLVTGETAGFAPGAGFEGFPAAALCYLSNPSDASSYRANVFVNDAETTALIAGVPVGWSCAVGEGPFSGQLADSSFAWGAPIVRIDGARVEGARPNTVTIDKAGATYAVEIENPITRVTGSFSVEKLISSAAPVGVVKPNASFSGSYDCVYNAGLASEQAFSGTWTREGAGVATLVPASGQTTKFPLGTQCAASENAPSAASLIDESWSWDAPTISAPVTITNSEVIPVVAVTNTPKRVYAALSVTKKYDGVDGAFAPDAVVSGTWSCSYSGAPAVAGRWQLPAAGGTVQIFAADGSVDSLLVPATSLCRVVEDTLDPSTLSDVSYIWNAPSYSPSATVQGSTIGSVTLKADAPASVTVTNSTQRAYGALSIAKQVTLGAGVSAQALDTGTVFSGQYSCSRPGTDAITGSWQTTAGASAQIGGVLLGSLCSVTSENAPSGPVTGDPSFSWLPYTVSAAAEVTASQPASITVTNPVVRLAGGFSITKAVRGDIAGEVAGSEYSFNWQCTALNGDTFPASGPGVTTAIPGGGVWNAPETIPGGSSCTVTERDLPAPSDPSFAWSTGYTLSGASAKAIEGGVSFVTPDAAVAAPVLVTATNTLTRTPGSYIVSKTADPASGSTVKPGQTINYTITVTPGQIGFVDDIVVTDDLSQLLHNAAINEASIVATQGTVTPSATELAWTLGRVTAGEPLTLKYSATVNADAFNVTLRNSITAEGELPPAVCTECTTVTEHFTPGWMLSKTSDPASGSMVKPGESVTYTLTATNTSQAVLVGAQAHDDISDVLASADLVEPLAAGLSKLSATALSWSVPTLAPGESATASYTVTVKRTAIGTTFTNVATPEGEGGSCSTTPEASGCTTTHRTQKVDLALVKTHAPLADGAVDSGKQNTIDYTLAVSNVGPDAASAVTVTDTLPSGLSYVDGTLDVPEGWTASFDGNTLTASYAGLFETAASASIRFTALVGELSRSGIDKPFSDLRNSACVDSNELDANRQNNCSTVETPVKSLAVSALAVCRNNTPIMTYSVTPFHVSAEPKIAMIWWTEAGFAARDKGISAGDSAALLANGALAVNYISLPAGWQNGQTISGEQLWPGAAVDAQGNPTAWPGWKKLPTGQWVLNPSDPLTAIRGTAVVEIRVNPTTASTAVYPPSTPACVSAPPATPVTSVPPSAPSTPTALASTGVNPMLPGALGAVLLALGALVALIAWRRRRAGEEE